MSNLREQFDRYASQGQPSSNFNLSARPNPQNVGTTNAQQGIGQTASFIIPQGGSSFQNQSSQNQSQANQSQRPGQNQPSQIANESAEILKWTSELDNSVVITSTSDHAHISKLRNAITELRNNYFSSASGLSVKGESKDELDRRFLLIEHELDGLLRRRFRYSFKDNGVSREVDFEDVLNEREAHIVELEKRI
jgi:hypothetical protein